MAKHLYLYLLLSLLFHTFFMIKCICVHVHPCIPCLTRYSQHTSVAKVWFTRWFYALVCLLMWTQSSELLSAPYHQQSLAGMQMYVGGIISLTQWSHISHTSTYIYPIYWCCHINCLIPCLVSVSSTLHLCSSTVASSFFLFSYFLTSPFFFCLSLKLG